MLHIERFQVNMLQENCYVVSDETKECVIIDCGAFYPEERNAITQYIRKNELKPVHLLVTHGHLDHNFGNDTIFEEFGLKPEVAQQRFRHFLLRGRACCVYRRYPFQEFYRPYRFPWWQYVPNHQQPAPSGYAP